MSTLLVVASAFAVAGVGVLFGMPWEIALILGAAVAPPDATAVAALGRLLPRRMFMKLKAESLTNDGTALVLYAIAVSLAVGGQVTPWSVTWTVLVSYVGGIAAGVVIALLGVLLLQRSNRTAVINVTMLLIPFSAFLVAELIHASGVLAVVVAGLIASYVSPRVTTASSRRQSDAVWPFGVFLLNGALFILIGLGDARGRALPLPVLHRVLPTARHPAAARSACPVARGLDRRRYARRGLAGDRAVGADESRRGVVGS
jgi:CPA1 family monovalent cation:H+ antiporter